MNLIFLPLTVVLLFYRTVTAQDAIIRPIEPRPITIEPQILCLEGQEPRNCGCDLYCDSWQTTACRGVCTDYERCFCMDGYVRETSDANSRCVPKEECNPCNYCDNKDCLEKAQLIRCGFGAVASCCGCDRTCDKPDCLGECFEEPQCLCPDGLYKDASGVCVKKESCFNCKDKIASTTCLTGTEAKCEGCDNYCGDTEACKPVSYLSPKCLCPTGTVRQTPGDPNSACIPKSRCKSDCKSQIPVTLCGKFTVAKCLGCDNYCGDKTDCMPKSFLTPRCLCQDGYVRQTPGDPNSPCVLKGNCGCKNQLASFSCPAGNEAKCEGCDNYCGDKEPCKPVSYLSPRCLCPTGTVRQTPGDPNSACIPKSKCKSDCKSQIPLTLCATGVPQCLGCDNYCGQKKLCLPRSYLTPKCLCPTGFVRQTPGDPNSPCVLKENCGCKSQIAATTCPFGTEATCEGCDNYCGDKEPCKPVSYISPRCLCPAGTVRSVPGDDTSECIPDFDCFKSPCERELPLIDCISGLVPYCQGCDRTCKDPNCFEQAFLHPQCFCPPGLLKNDNGECVKPDQCRGRCEDKLATAEPCTIAGQELSCFACDLTCEQKAMGAACLPAIIDEPRCFCKPGYYKQNNDPDSICIPEEFCFRKRCGCRQLKAKKKECGCNEEAKCIGCDQPCAPVFRPCQQEYYPEAKCFCKEGYLRFYDGECRPADQCMLRG